ncbi:MAG TPA: DUF2130 domain-containing protein [Thermoanaerobaculia bacterium]|jgi:hypothetical protein|nr:DUF2130 domain-containing protein [Thermoanaerobaculia bacterium]
MAVTTERCPWCGSTISHEKFVQVQNAIREEERRKLALAEKTMKAQMEKALFAERKAIAAERAKLAQEKQLAEKKRQREIAEIRAILEKDRQTALLKKDAEFARERDTMQRKISEMTRQIRRKSPGEIAEGAELDLFEDLRVAFPDDHITRTARGKAGYILQDVRYKGMSAGKIVIDSKQRAAWQHTFVTKLRQAQTEFSADHAILSTAVFPAGKKELFVDSGVIVIAPARVTVVIDVLRRALIAMHIAKLSDAERTDKLGALFKFITSSAFKKKLAEAEGLAGEALELDVQEKRAHDNVWKKRGMVLSRIKHVLREIDTEVSAIIEAPHDPQGSPVLRFRPSTRAKHESN